MGEILKKILILVYTLDADAIVPPVEVSIKVIDESVVDEPVIVINVLKVNVFPVPTL